MSQRKAKEYRQAMEQYRGVVEDVDDLKRRIGAMEARHRREDQLEISRRRRSGKPTGRNTGNTCGRSMQRSGGGKLPGSGSLFWLAWPSWRWPLCAPL